MEPVMSHPAASVVICCWTEDRFDDLAAAIRSVQAQTVRPLETIVVADYNANLLGRVRRQFPDVVAVENTGSQGLSGARNSGVATAAGEVVAFLDDDAAARPDWLEHLLAPYADPQVAGVGGAIEPAWEVGRPRAFPEEFHWVVGCTWRGMPTTQAPVRNLIGANMSFRREPLLAVGGFHAGLGRIGSRPLGCEETELCLRVRRAFAMTLLFEPRARVAHRVPRQRAGIAYFRSRCYSEGLSKAFVVRLAGRDQGLASERAYTLRTLPRGVVRGLARAVRHRDVGGLGQAVAIVAGLTFTTAGYLMGTMRPAVLDVTSPAGTHIRRKP
jgi:cellulose synthase/poly-beta-1,6-N-acetylglucosamine synthase-like glycosyltransferase